MLATPVSGSARPDRPRRGRDQAPEAAAALDRLVGRLERSRYARDPGMVDSSEVRADVEAVERALAAGVTPRAERRATWWPRSVMRPVRGRRTTRPKAAGPAPESAARVEELVG